MREILFRGKLAKSGKWSEGNLVVNKRGICIITPDETPLGTYGQVIPETVGQFTGLTDKNGNKIFEGDIVVVNTTSIDEEDGYGVIDWHEDTARFIVELPNLLVDFDNLYDYECEIIGNIHDNPDLLRGDKNEYIYGE